MGRTCEPPREGGLCGVSRGDVFTECTRTGVVCNTSVCTYVHEVFTGV